MTEAYSLASVPRIIPCLRLVADSAQATGLKWATVASGATFTGCILANTTNQSISNNVDTAITWDTETADTNNYHSTSSNTSRITIPSGKAGKYLIIMKANGDTYSSGTGQSQLNLYKNGSLIQQDAKQNLSGYNTYLSLVYTVDAAVNDYYEMYIFQNQGSTRTWYISSAQFAAIYLG